MAVASISDDSFDTEVLAAGTPVVVGAMDAWGDVRGTAMGRLVSIPVALAIEAVLNREIPAGVHGAPHDPRLLQRWLGEVGHLAQYLARIDHLD